MAINDGIYIYETYELKLLKKIEDFSFDYKPLNFSPDSQIMAYGNRGNINLYDLNNYEKLKS